MYRNKYIKGFTLVELLVALIVTGIVVSAVATLAHSLGNANEIMQEMGRRQAQVRYASVKISNLIKDCKLVCASTEDTIAVWRVDDSNDGLINIDELTFIQKGSSNDFLRLCEYSNDSVVALSDVMSITGLTPTYTTLIQQCNGVSFYLDTNPPNTRFVSISFEVLENNNPQRYEISAGLRNDVRNLLNETGTGLVGDDDY